MKDQLQTIRAGVAEFAEGDGERGLGLILAALAQLEAMVGKPVHQFRKEHCADWHDGHADHSDGGGPYEERTLYRAAPVSQQPQAEAAPQQAEAVPNDVVRDARRWQAMRRCLVGADFAPEMGGGPVVMFELHAKSVRAGPKGADEIADAAIAQQKGGV